MSPRLLAAALLATVACAAPHPMARDAGTDADRSAALAEDLRADDPALKSGKLPVGAAAVTVARGMPHAHLTPQALPIAGGGK
jgi:hypothetical protein